MLDRLDLAFEGQKRFVGNASHELRTPLAINRTLLEVTLMDPEVSEQTRQLCRTLLSTNERSEKMIEGLLLLARADNEPVERESLDLAEVVARDPKDKGVGLGLSIVRSVVRAHGGRIAAEPRPGGGLIVRVWLPVA